MAHRRGTAGRRRSRGPPHDRRPRLDRRGEMIARMLRPILFALAALALATPAEAAVKPLALADDDSTVALAGSTAVFSRFDIDNELERVLAVPVDGSARAATRLSLSATAGADHL